jgi:hydroxymethylbilane synthase
MTSLTIGSRGSRLAMAQSKNIRDALMKARPGLDINIKVIRTTGDRFLEASPKELAALSKGIFVKEIEEALLDRSIDLAVHSLKDLPVQTPSGLRIAAMPRREDPRDVLVSPHPVAGIQDLPADARVATSSPRRAEQLKQTRPDIQVLPLRGNVDTRIKKLEEQQLDAIVLAAAGLKRTGLSEKITCYLDPARFVPAPGQGCLAIETLEDAGVELYELLSSIEHPETREAVGAERKFQRMVGSGCNFPLGAFAKIGGSSVSFSYFVGYPETERFLHGTLSGRPGEAGLLADQAIQEVLGSNI